jgi:hypothetical protein
MSATVRPPQFPLARQGAGHAPLRRPGSVRRTTSIESRWPNGSGREWELVGRARDVATPIDGGAPVELGRGGFTITASPRREIVAIRTEPRHPRDQELVGVRAGGASREAIGSVMDDIRHSPLFQLLDDFAGASLVAGWIWIHWDPDWQSTMEKMTLDAKSDFKGPRMNICTGFAEGSSALDASLGKVGRTRTDVLPLENPADPAGWHAMEPPEGPVMRRARRIDLWREGASIVVDAGFQDSGNMPDGGRAAIHEYRIHAVIEAQTMVLQSLQAIPLILPFEECPGAAINALRMVGQRVDEFRQRVIETLPGTAGCTHLNDVLRALADVPELDSHLPLRGSTTAHPLIREMRSP